MKKLKWIPVPVSTFLDSKITILQDRAQMLSSVRSFFSQRKVLEVDCPSLTLAAPVDRHIDVMAVTLKNGSKRYLHSSAEYGMKRLLSQGIGDIYQLSHVFREGEQGHLHNPEFTMIEWYRLNLSFKEFLDETVQLIHLFLPGMPYTIHSYRDIFKKFTQLDYLTSTSSELFDLITKHMTLSDQPWDKDALLNLIMTFIVEPNIGQNEITIVTDYPASQSALAKTYIKPDGESVAERFEFYHRGIELGNGYHELTDPDEQRRRFIESNTKRTASGKDALPLDELFIESLSSLPPCYGVAVGFDRLLMLRHNSTNIRDVLPFHWDIA